MGLPDIIDIAARKVLSERLRQYLDMKISMDTLTEDIPVGKHASAFTKSEDSGIREIFFQLTFDYDTTLFRDKGFSGRKGEREYIERIILFLDSLTPYRWHEWPVQRRFRAWIKRELLTNVPLLGIGPYWPFLTESELSEARTRLKERQE